MAFLKKTVFKSFRIVLIGIILSFPFINASRIEAKSFLSDQDELNLKIEDGEKLKRKGDFHEAIKKFEDGFKIACDSNNKRSEIECLKNLGLLYWNTGQLKKSFDYYKQVVDDSRYTFFSKDVAECQLALTCHRLYEEGKRHCAEDQYENSIKKFLKAIDTAKRMRSKYHELKCLRLLSISYLDLNKLENFFGLNEKAVHIADELNHIREKGKCLNNIGLYYFKKNDYSKALHFYYRALHIARAHQYRMDESACLNNIGIIFILTGQFEKSLLYLEKALEIDREIDDTFLISQDLINLGELFRNRANFDDKNEYYFKALNYFKECFPLCKSNYDFRNEIRILNNIAVVYLNLDMQIKAIKFLELALKKIEGNRFSEEKCMILNNLGFAYFNSERINQAINHFKKAIQIGRKIGGEHILWEAYYGLGQCFESQNDFSRATENYERSIDIIDKLRSRIFLDVYKAGFVRDKLVVYESYLKLLFKNQNKTNTPGINERMFYTVERAKARAFLESLADAKYHVRDQLSPELKRREEKISQSISFILQSISSQDLKDDEREKLITELHYREDEYLNLLFNVQGKKREMESSVIPMPCRLEQVQEILDKRTGILEFFLGDDCSFLFFITNKTIRVYILPSRRDIAKSLNAFIKALKSSDQDFVGFLAAHRLYKELLFPLSDIEFRNIENLVIIPDGILNYLPFEVLKSEDSSFSSRKDYVIEKYNISYVPSSSSLLFFKKTERKAKHPKFLLAFGNPIYKIKSPSDIEEKKKPTQILKEFYENQGFIFSSLPFSQKEVKELAKLFPDHGVDIFLKSSASEKAIKDLPLRDYQIIHLACHGFLDQNNFLRSALILSLYDADREDGFLQAIEVYRLRFEAELIVLSACQTGQGKLERGEGILGISRIFFFAGARSVLSTLWDINDQASSDFMKRFYRYLSLGFGKAESLRLTKLDMIRSKYSHPYYWSGFLLSGDYSSKIVFK